MIANLNGEDDAIHSSSLGIIGPLPIKMSGGRAVAEVPPLGNVTIEKNLISESKNGVNETMPDKNDVQPDDGLVLGDLAEITVSNEADPLSHDVSDFV